MTLYTYKDTEENFFGYLAYGANLRPLAAGGMRVHPRLSARRMEALAETMQYKQSILRVNVDGAKCGIAYDPASPGKREAIRRFIRFLAPHLNERLSLGPDMGTTFEEIEEIAREEGISSVKAAIGRAQGLTEGQVRQRLSLLDEEVGQLTLSERRAGHGVAHAALSAARATALAGRPVSCALQGFGTLGRGAALTLDEAGVAITAIADENECVRAEAGLPVAAMLASSAGSRLTEIAPEAEALPREAVLGERSDLLVLAACENALTDTSVDVIQASVVVVGANEGLAAEEYGRLTARGILAVPDLVAGCGGSAAMDALFAPSALPTPAGVLDTVAATISSLVQQMLAEAKPETTSRDTAVRMARRSDLPVEDRPYGLRLLNSSQGDRRELHADSPDALAMHSR